MKYCQKSIVGQYNSWHAGTGISGQEEELLTGGGRGGGDSRAAESSATVDGGQAAISLRPDTDSMHTHVFESSQLKVLYGDLLYVMPQRD